MGKSSVIHNKKGLYFMRFNIHNRKKVYLIRPNIHDRKDDLRFII